MNPCEPTMWDLVGENQDRIVYACPRCGCTDSTRHPVGRWGEITERCWCCNRANRICHDGKVR